MKSAFGERTDLMSSVAFWYQEGIATDQPPVVRDLFWSKDVLLFEAEGPDSRLEVPFEVPEDGEFEVYSQRRLRRCASRAARPGVSPMSPAPSRIPTPSPAASPPSSCATGGRTRWPRSTR
jgi:hypothetical protein